MTDKIPAKALEAFLDEKITIGQLRSGGSARWATWRCENGATVKRTTTRIAGGPHHGKFQVIFTGPRGATYERTFSTRKAATARAELLYMRNSPKWAAKYGHILDKNGYRK